VYNIFKDMIKLSSINWITLFTTHDYKLEVDLRKKSINTNLEQKISYSYTLMKRTTNSTPVLDPNRNKIRYSGFSTSRKVSILSNEISRIDERIERGDSRIQSRNPIFYLLISQSWIQTTSDLIVNDGTYNEEIYPLIVTSMTKEGPIDKAIFDFFRIYTISDDNRKNLWRIKIGNKLRISRTVYEGFVSLLSKQGIFQKDVEKRILIDLQRTLPLSKPFKTADRTFKAVRRILMAFHLYRPDIGYVQGMTYIVCALYLYFDEYECFEHFCNLIITNDLFYYLYSFDQERVSIIVT